MKISAFINNYGIGRDAGVDDKRCNGASASSAAGREKYNCHLD